MSMSPAFRFRIAGTGCRTQLFRGLAQLAPEQFSVAGVVTRSTGCGQQIESARGGAVLAYSGPAGSSVPRPPQVLGFRGR